MDYNDSEHVCAEIMYTDKRGSIHSDVCGRMHDTEWHELLHNCLDEWLRNSNGTGVFYVGNVMSALSDTLTLD